MHSRSKLFSRLLYSGHFRVYDRSAVIYRVAHINRSIRVFIRQSTVTHAEEILFLVQIVFIHFDVE